MCYRMTSWVAVATLALLVEAQEVAESPTQPWWASMVLYQIHPRSFQDSDGDGSGDLRGIAEKVGYLKELGVDAVSLLPFYPSPMMNDGFDITNHKGVNPLYGTMQDLDDLAAKLKEQDIKLIVDFVPNHTSNQHPWFNKSINNDPDFKDFYVWMDPRRGKNRARQPPSNWLSAKGGSAWEWCEERDQYYLHIFDKTSADLNYRSDAVVANMTEVLQFWLDKGVDGVRLSGETFLYKYQDLNQDAPPLLGTDGDSFLTQSHKYYANLPETFALVRRWADEINKRVRRDDRERVMLLEVSNKMSQDYDSGKDSLLLPYSFNLMSQVSQATKPAQYKMLIDDWLAGLPSGHVATWTVGNHNHKRTADNYGPEMVDAMNLLTGVLPGVKVTYYGEEIGMRDTYIPWEQTLDPVERSPWPDSEAGGARDQARTPMQWDNTTSAGFSSNKTTWLPVNPNYWWLNVEAQRVADNSHLKVFQAMTAARKDPVLRLGSILVSVPDSDVLVVTRSLAGVHFVLVINMGVEPSSYSLQPSVVVAASINSVYRPGDEVSSSVELRPKAAVLVKTTPQLTVPSRAAGCGRHITLSLVSLALTLALTVLSL